MSDPLASAGKYRKAIVAAIGAAVLAVGAGFGVDSSVYSVVVAVLTTLGVYGVSNNA